MQKSTALASALVIFAASQAVPQDSNDAEPIGFQRVGKSKSLFVSGEGAAHAARFEFKVVSKGLVTFCRRGEIRSR